MTLAVGSMSLEQAGRVWAVVKGHLASFAEAWATAAKPPDLREFAPAEPPEVRRLVLIELVKVDLEFRRKWGILRPLEEYFGDFPELAADGGPPCDLICEDYLLRIRSGQAVDAEEYLRRFPGRKAELARLLGVQSTVRTTSIRETQPIEVAPGEKLDDFDLLALLGQGQFAKVFLARQRTMQRLVALKVSTSRGAEAETLAQLDHPNIVRVYDQRFLDDRGVQLVYMSYLPGGTLLDVIDRMKGIPQTERTGKHLLDAVDAALDRRGELPPSASLARQQLVAKSWPETVCALGAKLAAALDYAHRQNVLHRDLKPANVLLSAEGEPLLADFNVGFCSKLDGAGPAVFFGGSLAYMSPEHMEAFNPEHNRHPASLDGRSDLFGLAVTLWELLTGTRPYGQEFLSRDWPETLELMAKQRRDGPLPEKVAGLIEGDAVGLKECLLKCLAGDPDDRPANAGELATELELCLRPATRKLVRPAPSGWREFIERHPILALIPLELAPNLVGSAFNIAYNQAEIIDHWPASQTVFDPIILAVNSVFFPVGMAIFFLAVLRVSRGVRRVQTGDAPTPAELIRLRRQCLQLGTVAAAVCVGCWGIAGMIWPAVLRLAAGPAPEGMGTYIHFLSGLVICGLIAAVYPYFLVSYCGCVSSTRCS